jgi:SAM-dependent methyltransferase
MYIQYGCSYTGGPKEWKNFDASATLRFERIPLLGRLYTKNATRFPQNVMYGDIVRGLPVPDGECKGVFASHILEHLALDEFHEALENTKKLLRPGGIFRAVVPDLEWAAREYLRRIDEHDSSANCFLLRATNLGQETRGRGLMSFVKQWLNTSEHLWMWDAQSFRGALESHGFTTIRECRFADAEDPMFSLVENEHRFNNAVALEARV